MKIVNLRPCKEFEFSNSLDHVCTYVHIKYYENKYEKSISYIILLGNLQY